MAVPAAATTRLLLPMARPTTERYMIFLDRSHVNTTPRNNTRPHKLAATLIAAMSISGFLSVPAGAQNIFTTRDFRADHERWMQLVMTIYAGEGFVEMVWHDRALTRPQVELMAARTSALNECFY